MSQEHLNPCVYVRLQAPLQGYGTFQQCLYTCVAADILTMHTRTHAHTHTMHTHTHLHAHTHTHNLQVQAQTSLLSLAESQLALLSNLLPQVPLNYLACSLTCLVAALHLSSAQQSACAMCFQHRLTSMTGCSSVTTNNSFLPLNPILTAFFPAKKRCSMPSNSLHNEM